MARLVNRLVAAKVAKALEPGLYADGAGLYLQVGPSGTKAWTLRYMLNKRARQMGLGAYPTFSLADARERARLARQQITDGVDPVDERAKAASQAKAAAVQAMTFKEAAARYISANSAAWKNAKHGSQWESTLAAYAYPIFGKLDVRDVATAHVLEALEPIWTTKPETASRVRGRIESVLSWATARHLRTGDNPARWRGHLDQLLAKKSKVARVEHHAALAVDDMPAFMAALRKLDSISARALEFTILAAARTGETIGMTDAEVDLGSGVWIIPAGRMKAEKEHRVPLCPRALEVIKSVPREADNPHIFCGGRSGRGLSNMAMLNLLKSIRDDVTVHGFRSVFRDWAGDRTSFPREVIEAALAHSLKDKAEAAYRRSDALEKRRRLMVAWQNFCSSPAGHGDNVSSIRAAS